MRPPLKLPASFLILGLVPALAAAQVKTDLGAAATSGMGAPGAVGSSLTGGPSGVSAVTGLGVAPLAGTPSLSAFSAPSAHLAPSAAAVALPASALAPAPAAAPAEGFRPTASKAAAAPAAPPATPSASAASAPPGGPPGFGEALRRLGVPDRLTSRLELFLIARHPGDQGKIYHGEGHSNEVAGYTAKVVEAQDLPVERKVLLIVAAALHDIDPERVPETPARVSATLAHLDGDDEARTILSGFQERYGFTPAQVKALIMGTDFSMVPAEMKAKQDAFAQAAAEAFPGDDFGLVWGKRLAFVDQASTYLGGTAMARKRVEGLAHEIRSASQILGGQGPTDAQMLAGTAKFLAVLKQNPDFAVLPADLRANFDKVQSYFDARQTPEAWAAAAAPPAARAPPDVEAALRYVKSIASGVSLDGRKTDGLLTLYFEEHGIAPGSERAEAVRRALVPDRAAADDSAMSGLSPALARRRALMLRLAAKHATTPAGVEEILRRREVLPVIGGLPDEQFELQADMALGRDERERAVAGYPANEQGEFMRGVADAMSTVSGKSVEEVARDGVFAYVDFVGARTVRARAGRDPDVSSTQMVFYITRKGRRWRIDGYRQNKELGRKDSEMIGRLKAWLTTGGIPAADLE